MHCRERPQAQISLGRRGSCVQRRQVALRLRCIASSALAESADCRRRTPKPVTRLRAYKGWKARLRPQLHHDGDGRQFKNNRERHALLVAANRPVVVAQACCRKRAGLSSGILIFGTGVRDRPTGVILLTA
eukprot:366390-Chlamydomonas_euryale.AAC.27